jgi:hypothetical protein
MVRVWTAIAPTVAVASRPVILRALAAASTLAVVLSLSACGLSGDETVETFPPPSLEQWQAKVDLYCSDGIQEVVALPLPRTTDEVPDDALGRADILITVRDAVLPLPRPEGEEETIQAWLDDITADAKLLGEISSVAAAGGDYLDLIAELDESSGEIAGELGLENCVTLAQAIARTP